MLFPRLINEYFEKNVTVFPDKTALVQGEIRYSYREIDEMSDKVCLFIDRAGIQKQDRVVIFLENSVEAVASIYGVLKAGCVFVVVNESVKAGKLNYILKNSGATLLISSGSKFNTVCDAIGSERLPLNVLWVRDNENTSSVSGCTQYEWSTIISEGSRGDCCQVRTRRRVIDVDLAALIYTSGSTGEPKGVVSTHYNVVSAAQSIITYLENKEEDIIINVLPLSFDYGLYQMIMTFMFGGTLVLENNFAYPHIVLKKIEKEKVTCFPVVPTVLAMLLNMRSIEKYDLNNLRYISNTGAALPVEHIKKFRKMFPDVKVYSMFGLTECKRVAYLPPEEIDNKPSSVGKAMPNCETLIVDDDGNVVPVGEVGELVVRGSNVMQGYWMSPELTSRVYKTGDYAADRILHTGDYFKCDSEGYLYWVGRKDDMIKSKGERISPKEVENILCEMNGVAEAAVFGVPHEIFGQAVKAVVAIIPGNGIGERDIINYCTKKMENFMVPTYVEIKEELPRTPNGKIDKKILKMQHNA